VPRGSLGHSVLLKNLAQSHACNKSLVSKLKVSISLAIAPKTGLPGFFSFIPNLSNV
jgi:hypothetical protein